jgi:hypothetical protein
MSLIKAADVPKHLADRLKSRRLAARLSRGTAPIVPATKAAVPSVGEHSVSPTVN